MQSGKFRDLVTIEQPVETNSEGGDTVNTWGPLTGFVRIPAEVLPDRASEFFAAKQIQATRNAMVRLYFRPGITEKMRVVHHKRPGLDEYYDIVGQIDFQSRQHELRLFGIWRDAEGTRRGEDLSN
jgi:SPP1 family predicted phage head-tail adaptor